MGAQQFTAEIMVQKTTTDADAFNQGRQGAQYDNGHAGYTGSLAEKNSFVRLHMASNKANAERLMNAYMHSGQGVDVLRTEARDVVDDKWGPAGLIRFPIDGKTDGLLIFGWASS